MSLQIPRNIEANTLELSDDKITLITGPRQTGKTFFSKTVFKNALYLNFDSARDRKLILAADWPKSTTTVILDELHKMRTWKRHLKGIYDTQGIPPRLIVTGSARLDTFRKGGDSLAGRHHLIHLFPFTIAELTMTGETPEKILEAMLKFGSFPEPFLKGSERAAQLWRNSHLDVILRQDLLDLEYVKNIKSIEILVDLLAEQVGSSISYAALARALEVSPHTIKHWIQILENLYVIFVIRPYSAHKSKSILKEPKIYFFDTGRVTEHGGARFENLVALHLFTYANFAHDCEGTQTDLHYIRDKDKREVDFALIQKRKVKWLIEAKTSDEAISPALYYYHQLLQPEQSIQLLQHCKHEHESKAGPKTMLASRFLNTLK